MKFLISFLSLWVCFMRPILLYIVPFSLLHPPVLFFFVLLSSLDDFSNPFWFVTSSFTWDIISDMIYLTESWSCSFTPVAIRSEISRVHLLLSVMPMSSGLLLLGLEANVHFAPKYWHFPVFLWTGKLWGHRFFLCWLLVHSVWGMSQAPTQIP